MSALKRIVKPIALPILRALRSIGAESGTSVAQSSNLVDQLSGGKAFTEERIQYLLDEVSDLRIICRKMSAQLSEASESEDEQEQTKDSFSYQWENLKEGDFLLGDESFEVKIMDLAAEYSGLDGSWFSGKTVLDAGCGIGRWSYAFLKLGADVTAIDQSAQGIGHVKELLQSEGKFAAKQANILKPLPFKKKFDLVWSFGVTHHTGNTILAVENVAAAVKPGGRLFLMIYGEPQTAGEFGEVNLYVKHRRATQFMTFEEKIKYLEGFYPSNLVHGFFDAISPTINDLHRMDEIQAWLEDMGFVDFKSTFANRNHFIVADLPA